MTADQLTLTLRMLERTCDPDTALTNLVQIVDTQADRDGWLGDTLPDESSFARLMSVLGASDAMGKMMRARPDLVEAVAVDRCGSRDFDRARRREHILNAVGADPADATAPTATMDLAQAATGLRAAYYKQLATIMAEDMTAADPISEQPRISRMLADLADAALEGALAIARHEVAGSERCRFAIIGMGKLGAQELNYVSDVDPDLRGRADRRRRRHDALTRIGTKMATTLQARLPGRSHGRHRTGALADRRRLRPEGKDGPLVRRLDSHQTYYEQWAENWEFQALLKARPAAGDPELGQAYMDMTRPFVWKASQRTTSSTTASRCAGAWRI